MTRKLHPSGLIKEPNIIIKNHHALRLSFSITIFDYEYFANLLKIWTGSLIKTNYVSHRTSI